MNSNAKTPPDSTIVEDLNEKNTVVTVDYVPDSRGAHWFLYACHLVQ